MGLEQIYRCDVCGTIKGVANKWMGLQISPSTFTIYLWDYDFHRRLKNLPFDEDLRLVCGELCLHKMLQPFLDSRSQEAAYAQPITQENR